MCDYCSGNEFERTVFGTVAFKHKKKTTVCLSVDGENGVLHTTLYGKNNDNIGSVVKINFCPMCGRKL